MFVVQRVPGEQLGISRSVLSRTGARTAALTCAVLTVLSRFCRDRPAVTPCFCVCPHMRSSRSGDVCTCRISVNNPTLGVRDAEVAGSNPACPTNEVQVSRGQGPGRPRPGASVAMLSPSPLASPTRIAAANRPPVSVAARSAPVVACADTANVRRGAEIPRRIPAVLNSTFPGPVGLWQSGPDRGIRHRPRLPLWSRVATCGPGSSHRTSDRHQVRRTRRSRHWRQSVRPVPGGPPGCPPVPRAWTGHESPASAFGVRGSTGLRVYGSTGLRVYGSTEIVTWSRPEAPDGISREDRPLAPVRRHNHLVQALTLEVPA